MTHGLLCRSAACVLGAWVLAACGGGGGGSGGTSSSSSGGAGPFTVGGTLSGLASGESLVLADNGGDALTVSASGTFTFSTAVSAGGSYAVTVTTQPAGQQCSVTNGSGSALAANVSSVSISCTNLPQYAYVVNNGDNTIAQFAIGANGLLTPLSTPTIATGSSPQSVTVDPSHQFVFVTNRNDNTVSQYVIQADGTLAPNTPATVATGAHPDTLAFDAAGHAYVVNAGDLNITQFSLDSTGHLTRTASGPASTLASPWNLVFTADGNYAYVSDFGTVATPGTAISQFSLLSGGAGLGALSPATVTTGNMPAGSVVDAQSANLYVAGFGTDQLLQYAIGSGGQLTSAASVSLPAGSYPVYVALGSGGKTAYAVNFASQITATAGTVAQFAVGTGGALTALSTPTAPTGMGPVWMSFDERGQFAYVVNELDGTLCEYSVGADGSLTVIGTQHAGNTPFAIAVTY